MNFFVLGGMPGCKHILGNEPFYKAFSHSAFLFWCQSSFITRSWLASSVFGSTDAVTALLHAVAVVKAGIFACIRLVDYGYVLNFYRAVLLRPLRVGCSIYHCFGSIMAFGPITLNVV